MVKSIKSIPAPGLTRCRRFVLEIERNPALPFTRPATVRVKPHDITLTRPLWMGEKEVVQRRFVDWRRKEEQANAYSLEKGGILSLPFRQAAYWTGIGFSGIRRAFVSSDILGLRIKGQRNTWKIDNRHAWALDEGQAIDDIVNVQTRPRV